MHKQVLPISLVPYPVYEYFFTSIFSFATLYVCDAIKQRLAWPNSMMQGVFWNHVIFVIQLKKIRNSHVWITNKTTGKSYLVFNFIINFICLTSFSFKNQNSISNIWLQNLKYQTRTSKVHIFWEGHKILWNLPLTFVCM